MGNTKIEWCDRVWNPITGCSPISEGCRNCYARRMANRLKGRYGYPKDDPFRVTFHPDRLEEPFHWRKSQRVFVCSMGDLFHEKVERQWIDQVMSEIVYHYEHTFLILTKRPLNAQKYFADTYPVCQDPILPNLWLGVSISNQPDADKNIPILLQIPAAHYFISYEPGLGPVKLGTNLLKIGRMNVGEGEAVGPRGIDWVIAGGETGPGARPLHPDWVRSLVQQCQASGTPFFFKSWGEWAPSIYFPESKAHHTHINRMGKTCDRGLVFTPYGVSMPLGGESYGMVRVGHKHSGHLLDGKEYREFPK